MTQIKRSLTVFISVFLLSVICGSVLHNLFTSDRLQKLVVKLISDSAPGVEWNAHRASVELSDGFLPIVALSIAEVQGVRHSECGQNIEFNVRDVFLPLDMGSLIVGPVRLGKIRFHEISATEIPTLLQSCKSQTGAVVLKDGEVLLNNNIYEFKGNFEISSVFLNGEIIPSFTVSGLYVDKKLNLEILWRESKIFATYSIDQGILDFKATKLPSVELIKVFKGLGVKPTPQNLGPNWLDITAHFYKNDSNKLKVDEVSVSGDIGDLSTKDLDITLDRKPTFSAFKLSLKKVSVSELSKVLNIEGFPRFFRSPGYITGELAYSSDQQKFLGAIEGIEIDVSRSGRKSYFKVSKAHVELSHANSRAQAYIKDFETPNGVVQGVIHAEFDKNMAHVGFTFEKLRLDPKVYDDILSIRFGEAKIDGQLDLVDSKISRVSIKSKIQSIEGKGFNTSSVVADVVYNSATMGLLAFEIPKVAVIGKDLDNEPTELFRSIHKTIDDSKEWTNVRGQLVSAEGGGTRLRNMTFEYVGQTAHFISVLPDQNDSLTIWDLKKKKVLGKVSARL